MPSERSGVEVQVQGKGKKQGKNELLSSFSAN